MIGYPKPSSRLEDAKTAKHRERMLQHAFLTMVWTRDHGRCRKCDREVKKCLERIPRRGEVHHVHGKIGAFKYEDRCALLLCCACREQLTGRVAARWQIAWTKSLRFNGRRCIDARAPVTFIRTV